MKTSFKNIKQVPDELLEERIETVQKLKEKDTEAYEIVKDSLTGEHYIHYSYEQLNIRGDGEKEVFHHLLPIENDDVLSLIFDNPDYSYPEHWQNSYLRNGPDGHYVWFNPEYADDFEDSVKLGNEIKEKLNQFKQAGEMDKESIQKLLNEIDQLRKDKS